MRAILIDPKNRTVTEVNYTGDYRNINTHIQADCFDIVRIGDENDNTIFVDDEGLINDKARDVGFFRFDGDNPMALAGYGLILGTDAEGESIECNLSVADVYSRVAFGELARMGNEIVFVEHETGRVLTLAQ